jgi:hypothetical protein
MASNLKINTAARNAACNAIVDLIDAGTGAGRLEIRVGSPPTNLTDASSGNELATLTFSATAFGAAGASIAGLATAATITSETDAPNSGDAGYFRVYAGAAADTAALFQGTAGNSGDTPDMVFDNKSIVAGGTVACSSMTFTIPIQ